ncbi:hypothetical protein ACH0BF_22855, partial [Pseudobacillus sp. 179-B 2D1 NHS]|uniref:hypothetical protein n=1 Tax=Pseudobacillus sp. 179-B 2D1 NHS TaxID=3374292 RepID=UPI0038790DE6
KMTKNVHLLLLEIILRTRAATLSLSLKDWHVESDLWHHPRKYIMPSILIVLTMLALINQGLLVGVGLLALCSIGLLLIIVN